VFSIPPPAPVGDVGEVAVARPQAVATTQTARVTQRIVVRVVNGKWDRMTVLLGEDAFHAPGEEW
jgi:hypothetical protein